MKEATDRVVGVTDSDGYVVACNELSLIGSQLEDYKASAPDYAEQAFVAGDKTFKTLGSAGTQSDYAVFAGGRDGAARTICVIAAVAFNEARNSFEEKHNKASFIKSIISDNILPGDVYARAKELHFKTDAPRAVFLIRQTGKIEPSAIEIVSNLFPDKQKDFVFATAKNDISLITELTFGSDPETLFSIARQVEDAVMKELNLQTIIGIGTVAHHIRELADRHKEAQVAITVGKIFDSDKTIINYEKLGIGRIVYQLPNTLCEMFLSEVFKKSPIESIDKETLATIEKFFECNLNVSETSRNLFIHRNTLVYRLEKIKRVTGLDLREFEQAIVFKVALMVKQYLDSQRG